MSDLKTLVLFFSVYSFSGWIIETIFASIRNKRLVNRGFLTGFVCPIYGFGAILILQIAEWFGKTSGNNLSSLFISILFSVIMVTSLEYITGFLLEKIFNCKWWDYSGNFLNIKGYICLKYSLLWGLLAFLFIRLLHPAVSGAVFSIHEPFKGYLAAALLLYFFADTVKSVGDTMDLRRVILNYSSISMSRYYEKIIQYKRVFYAFPRLLILNAGIINRDIRSILNDRMDKIKVQFKSRFL